MSKLPKYVRDRKDAILKARSIQMEEIEGVDEIAMQALMEDTGMSLNSAERCLSDLTFKYKELYPAGHPGLDVLSAEIKNKGRRIENLRKIRAQVIKRDGSRCQNCNKRVYGRDAQLDHKDPEGPETLENVHLLCQSCNYLKCKMSWSKFRVEWAKLKKHQMKRENFKCENTGLFVRGRSWKEAGCIDPAYCKGEKKCMAEEIKEAEAYISSLEND